MEQLSARLQLWLEGLHADPTPLLTGLAGLVLLGVLWSVVATLLRRAAAERLEARIDTANRQTEAMLAELKGRMAAMGELNQARQAELASLLDRRLDHVSERLGQGLSETSLKLGASLVEAEGRTAESLTRLYERLARIDAAGQSLDDLSKEVVTLQQVLADKQMRGAFGQMRMEAILEDGLPRNAFELQATLSNGRRPDALIRLPSAPAPLAVDAKFPLEGFEALRAATTPEQRTQALARFRDTVSKHVDDVSSKYLIPGETQDTALLFVPSEAVYAELHERLPEVIQRAYRARVVIVSPNMLMLAVQTMQAIFKDVRMREQAGLIQREVGHLMGDVARLVERVRDLDKHFTLATKDVEKILTSTERIGQRAKRIDAVELEESGAPTQTVQARLAAGE
ncbi:MAG: DNA recombination protein RmuC [Hyphomicrobiaceae bacterium]